MRYNKKIEEDKIFRLATPHYDKAQKTIVFAVKKNLKNIYKNNLHILEIGCGTGLTTDIILNISPKINLVAIDKEKTILEQTKKRFNNRENKRLTFLHIDAFKYLKDQPTKSLDAVLSAMTLHNCSNKYRSKVYKEIFRVLKKGGIFVNVDKIASDNEKEHKKVFDWQMKQFNIFKEIGRQDLEKKWKKHYIEDEKPNVILREGQYVNELKEIGFNNIKKLYRKHMEVSYVASN